MRTPVRAAILEAPRRPMRIATVHIDAPEPQEVLVRVAAVGLCHSDLHYVTGSLSIGLPVVLGHEVAGVVEQVGPQVTRLAPGDRVVASVTPACGACRFCLRGRPTQCARVAEARLRPRARLVDDAGRPVETLGAVGAFAEKILVTERSLAKVPAHVPAEVACLLGCCVTTGVGAVTHGAAVGTDHTVAVIGCGGVGIAAIQGARLAGARRIVAIDVVKEKLDAAQRFGATDVLLAGPDEADTRAQLEQLIPGGVDRSFEAVGRSGTAALAFGLLAPTGVATILGLMPQGEQLTIGGDELVYGDSPQSMSSVSPVALASSRSLPESPSSLRTTRNPSTRSRPRIST
ncbi:alcohol dehydrogenase catalytic domain-containing protein, partial [Pseudonocardia sp.]|uniref:alcohol dehydrogenase catalytic domain-containing protein n=1 Tax=Pseudonocardia sp. TaxID=60912 RepID=UPI003D0C9ED9